jgi:6-pyruvoyltetrahydropterin/6-carboxytetrahydropterin synthase
MATLTRTVRFAINAPQRRGGTAGRNGYAGSPPMRGLGRHYALEVRCRGAVDATTGYLINIKDIDQAVRRDAVPIITRMCDEDPAADPSLALPGILGAVELALPGLVDGVRWWLTPYYSIEMRTAERDVVLLRQRFDFAASHRLHVPSISDAENRALFGKCNNVGGHGHNYQFEPTVAVRLGQGAGFSLDELERLADDVILQRFDHKNLSTDVPEFAAPPRGSGVNPSVEQIARVFFELLAPAIERASPDARLRSITVWETDRTSSTYPAD